MNRIMEIEKLQYASSLVLGSIPRLEDERIPSEVTETLEMARSQIKHIPAALDDLAAAKDEFSILDMAVSRLQNLAEQASRLPEDDHGAREALEREFIYLAGIVAQTAGRKGYDRPSLSLADRAQAAAAQKTLGYLTPVKEQMTLDLFQQENLIIGAIRKTLDFLETVAECYPEAVSLSTKPDLLQRVSDVRASLGNIGPREYGLH